VKILVVDDSPIVREIVATWLTSAGHAPIAIDGAAAFARVTATEHPDLVLMDVDMPGLSGVKLASLAASAGLSDCPIVLHSGRTKTDLARACLECGAKGFIEKTDSPAKFLKSLEGFLR
jgi:CheY-like chemotaxis protein